jgi:uncharacterized protein
MRTARGVGLGLRHEFAAELLRERPAEVEWLEVHPENYVQRGGLFAKLLADASGSYALLPHGLTLSLGSAEPFDAGYLRALRRFLTEIRAPFYSDHLCWSAVDGRCLHDLLPLPFIRDSIVLAASRIAQLQDALGIPVAVENISYYAHPGLARMSELDFFLEVLEKTHAKVLLDVNNVYVNSRNHGFDARAYLDRIPVDRVVQLHVAGHATQPDGTLIDTHAEPLAQDVLQLLEHVLARTPNTPILLERDGNYPSLATLCGELREIHAVVDRVHARSIPPGNEEVRA